MSVNQCYLNKKLLYNRREYREKWRLPQEPHKSRLRAIYSTLETSLPVYRRPAATSFFSIIQLISHEFSCFVLNLTCKGFFASLDPYHVPSSQLFITLLFIRHLLTSVAPRTCPSTDLDNGQSKADSKGTCKIAVSPCSICVSYLCLLIALTQLRS